MLVYGDPQFSCSIADALAKVRTTLTNSNANNLDSLREVLIQLGQLEQAIADLDSEHSAKCVLERIQQFTDLAADLFCAVYSDYRVDCSIAEIQTQFSRLLVPPCTITIKIPEGFEFYSLFPEEFIHSARHWSQQHRNATLRDVIVIGIRSIGTTLSAVVSATLKREGWRVNRITVRPSGHPFNRFLKEAITLHEHFAVIVDEGPGLSGSSMVAVAEAVLSAGIARENITFFPGHDNEPGSSASQAVRDWWRTTPRFFTPLESLRWKRRNLSATLLDKSAQLVGKTFVTCENLSGGNWRRFFAQNKFLTLPSFAPFERSKFLCIAEDGFGLLWKFNGLGSLPREQGDRGDRELKQFVVGAIGNHCGFCALPWLPGEPLTAEELSLPLVEHLANYLVASADESLSHYEHESAIERLVKMAYWNTEYVMGEAAATDAITHADAARNCNCLPCYGDGRLAPWEWIRLPNGKMVKTDWFGHNTDHTMVGRQCLLWDIAGLLVEWNFSEEAEQFLMAILAYSKIETDPGALAFFRTAYSAFQMGKSAMCERIVSNSNDKMLLKHSTTFYRTKLSESLGLNRSTSIGRIKNCSALSPWLPE